MNGTAPIAVPPAGFTLPGRRSLERAILAIVAAFLAAVLLAALVSVLRNSDDGHRTIALSAIPTGVSAQLVDGHPIIAVRSGSTVALFDGWSPRGELVRYCAATFRHGAARFETPLAGSVWEVDGRKLIGPDPRGLDRYDAEIADGRVTFDPGHPQLGAALQDTGPATTGTPIVGTVSASVWIDPFTDSGACN